MYNSTSFFLKSLSHLLVKRAFFLLNAAFAMAILDIVLKILQLQYKCNWCYAEWCYVKILQLKYKCNWCYAEWCYVKMSRMTACPEMPQHAHNVRNVHCVFRYITSSKEQTSRRWRRAQPYAIAPLHNHAVSSHESSYLHS
jgi:hypothetical protein